ncbi:MAG: hypothetical protein BWK74_04260 [Desulfobacteraceae bacterium A6]|nr:MAG: hypothetical protein BWK74_04260 [Desulfobacteraceae bacterium A6]
MNFVIGFNNDRIKIFTFDFRSIFDRQNIFGKLLIILFVKFYTYVVAVYCRCPEYVKRIFFFRYYRYCYGKILIRVTV